MRLRSALTALALPFTASCVDVGLTQSARCDGILQPGEETVDDAFDRDGDGYFDGNNEECVRTYPPEVLDCNDAEPDVNPGGTEVGCNGLDDDCDAETPDDGDNDGDGFTACEECDDWNADVRPNALEVSCNGLDDDCNPDTLDGADRDNDGYTDCDDCDDTRPYVNPAEPEIFCNGLDDDCNPATEDGEDRDGDGVSAFDDCDDNDATAYPGGEEVCDDNVDNDCDGEVDGSCGYTGRWVMDTTINHYCAFGSINFNFNALAFEDYDFAFYASPDPNANPPGTMTGDAVGGDGTASATVQIAVATASNGTCQENYTVSGQFVNEDEFVGSFEAVYRGFPVQGLNQNACFDCVNAYTGAQQTKRNTWTFTAHRQ